MDGQQLVHPTQLNLYRLPNETWILIFEAITYPPHLLKIIKTCKHFYALAIRALYRNVHWMNPLHFVHNISFWTTRNGPMVEVPTSLVIGISNMHVHPFTSIDPASAVVEIDGSWSITPANVSVGLQHFLDGIPIDLTRIAFFASRALYAAVSTRISTFVMLRELIFHHADLPDTTYDIVRSLPRLKHLSIQYCTLPKVRPPGADFTDLPITELTLWCVRGDPDQHPRSNHIYALQLCTARNIRCLRMDWTTIAGRFFSRGNPYTEYTQMTNLEDVTLRMPVAKHWPEGDTSQRSLLIRPLAAFLRNSPSIKRLAIVNRLPSLELLPGALPDLIDYSGPISTVLSVLGDRPVKHLEMTDIDRKWTNFTHFLPLLAKLKPELQTLSFMMREWDNEILYAISELFSDLRKICIKYEESFPSEYTLLSLGAQFLHRFPLLETLQLYQLPDLVSSISIDPFPTEPLFPQMAPLKNMGPGASDSDEEVKELIVPWRKHCRYLREVQFVEGLVWRRAFDGDEWCKRCLEYPDKFRELLG